MHYAAIGIYSNALCKMQQVGVNKNTMKGKPDAKLVKIKMQPCPGK